MERTLGRSGITVSAIGLGCWAIGGPFWLEGKADGWGDVDDDESVRAIGRALEFGVRFFDTADVYGTGHSEAVLGRALAGHRSEVVVSTKFGYTFDPETKQASGTNASAAYVRAACEASLRRLGTDYIDLYQLHIWSLPQEEAEEAAGALENRRREGKIRAYGWSTDDLDCARLFATRPGCSAIEHDLNVLDDAPELIQLCEQNDLASIDRTPLAMGLLSGKFETDVRLPRDDVRGAGRDWVRYFEHGKPKREHLERLRRSPRNPAQQRPHTRPGSARLALGAQRPHHPDPRFQDRHPGGGERPRTRPGTAHGRAATRDRDAPRQAADPHEQDLARHLLPGLPRRAAGRLPQPGAGRRARPQARRPAGRHREAARPPHRPRGGRAAARRGRDRPRRRQGDQHIQDRLSSPGPPMLSAPAGFVPGPQHGLGRGAAGMAGVAGQRFGLADPGDRQHLTHRGAGRQVIAGETGPAPAHAQPRRGRIRGQAPGEIGDECLSACAPVA